MTRFFLDITDRGFNGTPVMPPYLTPQFNDMRWSVFGGCLQSSVTLFGPPELLFRTISLLRCPVLMYDEISDPVWWGYVNEVQVRRDAMEVGVTLDNMANRIAIEYNAMVAGEQVAGERYVTDWAEDTPSRLEYGTKELLESLADATADVAEHYRDLLLDQRKYPVPIWYPSDAQASASATLLFRGWWDSLGWLLYSDPSGVERYVENGEGVQNIGDTSATQRAAQSFSKEFDIPWSADTIEMRVRKSGTPADNLVVDLCADSAGAPGTVLATAQVAAANIPTDYNWIAVSLSVSVSLAWSTSYWIRVSRTGSVDADNYYVIDVNEELGYPRGSFLVDNAGAWEARDPNADMEFQVKGVRDTSEQIERIFTQSGQFIQGVRIRSGATGVYSIPYRPGDMYAIDELVDLLNAGTSNNRRLLATVEPDRYVEIYEEPEKAQGEYSLTSTGQVWRRNILVPKHKAPLGQWLTMKDIMPGNIDTTMIADPGLIFIEESQYSPNTDTLTLYPRTIPSPWDVGMSSVRNE